MLKSKDQKSHYQFRANKINKIKNQKIKDNQRKTNFNLKKTKKETLKQIILNKLSHNEKNKPNENKK